MDPARSRRRVSSAATYRDAEVTQRATFASLLDKLPPANTQTTDHTVLKVCINTWRDIEKFAAASGDQLDAQDAFRRSGGLDAIIPSFLIGNTQLHAIGDDRDILDDIQKLHIVLFNALSFAIFEHAGNRRYFGVQASEKSWTAVEKVLSDFDLAIASGSEAVGSLQNERARLYGCVFAFGTRDAAWLDAFQTSDGASLLASKATLWNAEAAPLILQLCLARSSQPEHGNAQSDGLHLVALQSLLAICKASQGNRLRMHQNGVAMKSVYAFMSEQHSPATTEVLRKLALELFHLGPLTLSDAQALFSLTADSSKFSQFLLDAVRVSRDPIYVHFDLTLHGFASLELIKLPGPFPPTVPSTGYTFMAWCRFDQFDPKHHTTLFGALDASRTCFVLIYVERESRQLIFQTSDKSPKSSVRFKSFSFEEGQWYHIAIVHKRTATSAASRAALFVNGEFREQVKSNFPASPPLETVGQDRASRSAVQCFLGTPKGLSPVYEADALVSKHSLASAHLISEALPDELVFVYQKLGPRYSGNFQDCLGSFQTYRASAELNLRNEILHAGKEELSTISAAIRLKASRLNPENHVLLSISGAGALITSATADMKQPSAKAQQSYIKIDGHTAIANAASPVLTRTTREASNYAVLAGGCTLHDVQPFDDSAWKLSGCVAVGLNIIRRAEAEADIARSVDILFEFIQDSWRNSEAMERGNGFGLLAWAIRGKILQALRRNELDVTSEVNPPSETLSFQLLKAVLRFVGYTDEVAHSSIIINPLAYRILLVDLDVWRKADVKTQSLYFEQFSRFASESQQKLFNGKRLNRMRIVKKFLDSFKGDPVDKHTVALLMKTFKNLVLCTMSSEVMRSLALFITYALNTENISNTVSQRIRAGTSQNRRRGTSVDSTRSSTYIPIPAAKIESVPMTEVAIMVLETFADPLVKDKSTQTLRRFAKTVTNKWLLHLFAEREHRVIVLAGRILSRLLVIHGTAYVEKFAEKSNGFAVLQGRLRPWWSSHHVWAFCFATLIGLDLQTLDLDQPFTPSYFSTVFAAQSLVVRYPQCLGVMSSMLDGYVKIQSAQEDMEDVAVETRKNGATASAAQDVARASMAFLIQLHKESPSFREALQASAFTKDLFKTIQRTVSPPTSYTSVEQEISQDAMLFPPTPIISTPTTPRFIPVRRASSFVLVSPCEAKSDGLEVAFEPVMSCTVNEMKLPANNSRLCEVFDFTLDLLVDQLLQKAEFSGFGIFFKAPTGTLQDRISSMSFLMQSICTRLVQCVIDRPETFCEPRVLANVTRFTTQVCEATFEGWFSNGALATLKLVNSLLSYLQSPAARDLKSVRLCAPSIASMRNSARKVTLFHWNNCRELASDRRVEEILGDIEDSLPVLLYADEGEDIFIKLLTFQLYISYSRGSDSTQTASVELWRKLIALEPEKLANIISYSAPSGGEDFGMEFVNTSQNDVRLFRSWLNKRKTDLEGSFCTRLRKLWTEFVRAENTKNQLNARTRIARRKDRQRQQQETDSKFDAAWDRHLVSTSHWISNIRTSELLKHQRAGQDQQDNLKFMEAEFEKLERQFLRTCDITADNNYQWQLDEAEGRDRIRLRLVPSHRAEHATYRSKRAAALEATERPGSRARSGRRSARNSRAASLNTKIMAGTEALQVQSPIVETVSQGLDIDGDDFEIITAPAVDVEDPEDKNRKVLRSLQRGEVVQDVCNVSRIVGLEACESLLIIGKDALYLLDNLFHRSDGEIVNVWNAPQEERDPYVQMISGRESIDPLLQPTSTGIEERHWAWSQIISISKRHFLFRDVALEAFFKDGRSYLLTTISVEKRDELFAALTERAPESKSQASDHDDDDNRRISLLRQPKTATQALGFKLPSVFGSMSSPLTTRSWQRGEMSNFHYLMLVNTMAGRTFNDLTQYPVFPWIIADYTSEELDLTNPRTFRDLSRPMGCQTPEREAIFKERYHSFGEMTDHQEPAFHYGTHYSSAMIVASYLIRLQPFVQSYMLMQGGSFDHADRLFYSIEKAWLSASREGMSDVRELTPEFFYLPDFLLNVNSYDFGVKEGDGQAIGDVQLPPWAKGDPTIFIAKHREALESPFVSENLHHWIDLIFGYKQRGEAAIESTNVFHYLSYHGARNLDTITDPMERLATIGIIHNFGQTPRQVFPRPHESREDIAPKTRRLDTAADSLAKIRTPVLETGDVISNLQYSARKNRLICSSRHRIFMPPDFDAYLQWDFADGSMRCFTVADKTLLGLFEQLHQGQVSCALFADSKTLVTASYDSTIAVWWVTQGNGSVALHPKGNLFGHREAVVSLTVSRPLSVIVSASKDGIVILWDLNRMDFMRELTPGLIIDYARINHTNGHVMLCGQKVVLLYTLNGELLLQQNVCDSPNERLICGAFYENEGNEWLEQELIFTGHSEGIVKVWCLTVTHLGKWQMQLINRLDHADNSRGDGRPNEAAITSILPMSQSVYTGDEKGRVHKWECTI